MSATKRYFGAVGTTPARRFGYHVPDTASGSATSHGCRRAAGGRSIACMTCRTRL